MIKFFRKIRQEMLNENKFSKYILYAIGEIVLVVIGILIALNINNWNHEQQQSKKEKAYLENLTRDLENQISSIDIQLEYEQKYVDIGSIILDDYFESNTIVVDSVLCVRLNILIERKTFVRTDPTFEDMISSGNIRLLKDNDFRNALIEFYQELERVEKVVQNNNTLHTDQAYAQAITDLILVGKKTTDRLINISTKLLQDPEREMKIINLITRRHSIAIAHVETMNDLRIKTNKILERLKKAQK